MSPATTDLIHQSKAQKALLERGITELTTEELDELVQANAHVFDDDFDRPYAASLHRNIFSLLNRYYFRSQFIGFEEFPERNNPAHPLIFISNHSGMAFPWDGMVLGAEILKMKGYDFRDAARPLVAPMLTQTRLMNPFLIPNFWKKGSGVNATALNFETLMRLNCSNALIYPEGVPGIGKGFNNKYQLQQFSSSFVHMSLKYRTDIVPILCVNAEYINPWSYKAAWVDKLVRRIGIPFLPLSPILIGLIFQPWLFYFAFPARLTYVIGRRIKAYDITDKPYEEMTPAEIKTARDFVRASMQTNLDEAVKAYGDQPYRWREYFANLFQRVAHLPFLFSPGWVLLFSEHERQYQLSKDKENVVVKLNHLSLLRVLWHNPFSVFFFIPVLGWLPILLKGYKGATFKATVSEPK